MSVKLVLKRLESTEGLLFEYPNSMYKDKLNQILDKCHDKTNDYVSITIDRPYKPRTTGKHSQNNCFWGYITQIANGTGNELSDVEDYVKERALKRGYPYYINQLTGKPKPVSTTKINTVEMSYLIDECVQLASEHGIVLSEVCQN